MNCRPITNGWPKYFGGRYFANRGWHSFEWSAKFCQWIFIGLGIMVSICPIIMADQVVTSTSPAISIALEPLPIGDLRKGGPEAGFKLPNGECWIYSDRIVRTDDGREADEGTYKVFRREGHGPAIPKLCEITGKSEYDGSDYFVDIHGDYSLEDSGSSTGPRGFSVINLVSKKQVFSKLCYGWKFTEPHIVSCWEKSDEPVTSTNCPQAGADRRLWAIVVRHDYDILKSTEKTTADKQCKGRG